MNKLLLSILALAVSACATGQKCQSPEKRENSIFNPQTCEIYVRDGFYLDQISPDGAEKAKHGEQIQFNWIPKKTVGNTTIPAHAEIVVQDGG